MDNMNGIRKSFCLIFEANYPKILKDFLLTNPLADEEFFIKQLLSNQQKEIKNLKGNINFFDLDGDDFQEILRDDTLFHEWYENKKKRDQYWILKEYYLFLDKKLKKIESNKLPLSTEIEKRISMTLKEIALFHYYKKEHITLQNADSFAATYGLKSGKKLYQHYIEYCQKANRVASGESLTKQKNKIQLFEKVIEHLHKSKFDTSKVVSDLQTIKDNFENQ